MTIKPSCFGTLRNTPGGSTGHQLSLLLLALLLAASGCSKGEARPAESTGPYWTVFSTGEPVTEEPFAKGAARDSFYLETRSVVKIGEDQYRVWWATMSLYDQYRRARVIAAMDKIYPDSAPSEMESLRDYWPTASDANEMEIDCRLTRYRPPGDLGWDSFPPGGRQHRWLSAMCDTARKYAD